MKDREIKFRAWDLENKIWIDYIKISGSGTMMTAGDNRMIPIKNPEDIILQQFTGLLDKKGTEIYEGDILIIHQIDSDGQETAKAKNIVRWNNGEAKFDFEWTTNGLVGIGGNSFDLFLHNFRQPRNKESATDWYFEIEVIGNIFEDEKLL